jgi:hypothetical protein
MHARYRDRFFAGFALIEGNHATPVHTNGDMISFLTGDDTPAAVDATFDIA